MPYPITHKCDVYSFGMLLFDIIGSRSNLDINFPESKEWFSRWIWEKIENGYAKEVMIVCRIEEKDREVAERMVRAALWCVQDKPESRPLMSYVVKMLEGAVEVPMPPNPFPHAPEGAVEVPMPPNPFPHAPVGAVEVPMPPYPFPHVPEVVEVPMPPYPFQNAPVGAVEVSMPPVGAVEVPMPPYPFQNAPEGAVEVPVPPYPFLDVREVMPTRNNSEPTQRTLTTNNSSSFDTKSSSVGCATPIMRKYEIEIVYDS
ncbi:hypothetical protein SLEP1_g53962 [Rubroshorea leprosula]|uniref:Protein kinase domain-containing protein n=1 Tax=Rubroshorea leprosula TaxID=152421 RepID=A0AAV5MAW8_9ROSI|nr:hypothetical protein SLEP1_g53962 [Rubroshorea leprosula]